MCIRDSARVDRVDHEGAALDGQNDQPGGGAGVLTNHERVAQPIHGDVIGRGCAHPTSSSGVSPDT